MEKRIDIWTVLVLSCLFVFILALSSLFILAIKTQHDDPNYVPPQPEVLFYKDIPVEVVESKITWSNAKTNTYRVMITVKSEEYGLKKSFEGGPEIPHFTEAFSNSLKPGQIINAELYSWKQGDRITRRDLNKLVN